MQGQKNPAPDGRTVVSGHEKVAVESLRAVIEMDLDYVPGTGGFAGKAILREHRTIEANVPRPDGSYLLDWTMAFTAPGRDVTASANGYGGLGLRAPTSVKGIRVLSSEGRRGSEAHTQQARWVDFSAVYSPGDKPAGLTMFDHPRNPRHPSFWWVGTDPRLRLPRYRIRLQRALYDQKRGDLEAPIPSLGPCRVRRRTFAPEGVGFVQSR